MEVENIRLALDYWVLHAGIAGLLLALLALWFTIKSLHQEEDEWQKSQRLS